MNLGEFIEIFENDEIEDDLSNVVGCNALEGLNIIKKYMPTQGIGGASHDVIYSVLVTDLVEQGITISDALRLKKLNWMIEGGEYMACFV